MANDGWQQGPWNPADFEQLAQRYWGAWADAIRLATAGGGEPGSQAASQAWRDAARWWTSQARGSAGGVEEALGRFSTQAYTWLGQMQELVARFAGRDGSASDIAQAWRELLETGGSVPLTEVFRSMRGQGLNGLDRWLEDASPYLDAVFREGKGWLGLPAFGAGREHQERLQQLAQAHLEYQDASRAYNALLLKASQEAFGIFEDKLAERDAPGQRIESTRELFDLWIDAAEEAYARVALSTEFRKAYGALANAQMRLRAGIQAQVEQAARLLDLPTRSELDGAHRKIAALERTVRQLRDAVEAGRRNAPQERPESGTGTGRAARKAPRKAAGKRAAAKKPAAAKKAASKQAASKKPASKKAASKKAAKRGAAKRTGRES